MKKFRLVFDWVRKEPIDGAETMNKDGCRILILRSSVSGYVGNERAGIYFYYVIGVF